MTQWGLDTIFNPAKRHMDEEKRRLQSTREEIGDSSGGKRIDLESGKVVIPRPPSAESDPDSDPDSDAEADSDEATTAAAGADDGAESSSDASTRESVAADHDVPDTLAQAAARRARERRTG